MSRTFPLCAAALAAFATLSLPTAARADDPILPPPVQREPAPRQDRFVADPITDGGMLSVALGFSALLEAIISTGELKPQQPVSTSKLLSIDRSAVTQSEHPRAGTLSNIGVFSAGAYALAAPIITGVEHGAQAGLIDGIIFAESVAFTWAATDVAKVAVRRPRPLAYRQQEELYARYGKQNAPDITTTDSALSFFSGHTATTAAISATATYMAFARSPGTLRPWLTLIAGIALTTFVGVERVQAGKHFPTDVIAGAMAGAGIGVIVPHLHREDSFKQRPVWIGGGFEQGGGSLSVNGLF